ncbi:deazapurine DNA modification protein DpdA family protein [Saccharopolyspora sp. NPDC003752]
MRSLAARGYRLHAFGAKVLGLGRYADAISSSDSAAWSFRSRYVSGCSPSHRSESNCVHFALSRHAHLMESLPTHHAQRSSQHNRQPRISTHAPEIADRRPLPAAPGPPRRRSTPPSAIQATEHSQALAPVANPAIDVQQHGK